jgi:hypothetical protein
MQTVEAFTHIAVTACNAAINIATLRQQAAMAGIGMVQKMTGTGQKDEKDSTNKPDNSGNKPENSGNKPGNDSTKFAPAEATSSPQTQPTPDTINDPALLEVIKVLQMANNLQLLVAGGPKGGPDWENIRKKVRNISRKWT